MALLDRPDGFGLRPDRAGWVSLMDLMGAILDEPDFSWVTVEDVEQVVGSEKPRRFEIAGTRIRPIGAGGAERRSSGQRSRRKKKPRTGSGTSGAAKSQGSRKADAEGAGGTASRSRRRRRRSRRKKPTSGKGDQGEG